MVLTEKQSALVVILNEPRGLRATEKSLRELAFSRYAVDFAYVGSRASLLPLWIDYRWEIDEPDDWILFLNSVASQSPRKFLDCFGVDERSQQLGLSGLIQFFFRDLALEKIRELELKNLYQWVFFVRSDYLFRTPFPGPDQLGPFEVFILDGESYGGLNDRFLGFSTKAFGLIERALDIERIFSSEGLIQYLEASHRPNPEKVMMFLFLREGIAPLAGVVSQRGYCVRMPHETSRWSMGYFSPKRGLYLKYPTELALGNLARISPIREDSARPLVSGGKVIPSSSLARLVRLAGSQPRLLLAPLLLVVGELEVSRNVFTESKRNFESLSRQLWEDLRRILVVLKRPRNWSQYLLAELD